MTLHYIDGEQHYFNSATNDGLGVYNSDIGKTVYNLFYFIESDKKLSKKEIDKIGVFWSTGYEEYIIYNVDFFIRQFDCLEKVK